MDILEDLKNRGLIYQTINLSGLEQRLKKGPIVLYCGFDPTAESLHVGNLLLIITLRRFQLNGHQPIIIVGGATGMIGDPSGKNEERPLQTKEIIKKWDKKIKKQLKQFLDFKTKDNPALLLDNFSWHSKINFLDFLRNIGKHFTVAYLLAKETIKKRLESGISFTEFSYSLLQAYDFYYLFKKYNCELQIGGSDQWGNITSGIDLIKTLTKKEVFGLTLPLITTSSGEKFGKSSGKAIWLDKKLTSPYQFYQFWINTPDSEVIKLLKYFTFLTTEEIDKLEQSLLKEPEKREAQKTLAFEITKIVHGEKEAQKAQKISRALFYNEIKSLNKKELEIATEDVPVYHTERKNISLVDLLVLAQISSSKRQAREDILKKSISINGEIISDLNINLLDLKPLFNKYLIIRRGKKNYYLVDLK
ncbi:MAG: tyrosine--tRNA ligase [Minisyncoccia bacterium]